MQRGNTFNVLDASMGKLEKVPEVSKPFVPVDDRKRVRVDFDSLLNDVTSLGETPPSNTMLMVLGASLVSESFQHFNAASPLRFYHSCRNLALSLECRRHLLHGEGKEGVGGEADGSSGRNRAF